MSFSEIQQHFKKIVQADLNGLQTHAYAIALHAFFEYDENRMKILREEAFSYGFKPEEWVYWTILKEEDGNSLNLLEDWPTNYAIDWTKPPPSSDKKISLLGEVLESENTDLLKRALELGASLTIPLSKEGLRPLSYSFSRCQTKCVEWMIENTDLLKDPVLVADACLTMEIYSTQSDLSAFNIDILKKIVEALDEATPITYSNIALNPIPFLKLWVACTINTRDGEDILFKQKWSKYPEKFFPNIFGTNSIAQYALEEIGNNSVLSLEMLIFFRKLDEKLQLQNLQSPLKLFWDLLGHVVKGNAFLDLSDSDVQSQLSRLLEIKPIRERPLSWKEWSQIFKNAVLDKTFVNVELLKFYLSNNWLPHLEEQAQEYWIPFKKSLEERLEEFHELSSQEKAVGVIKSQLRLDIQTLPEEIQDLTPKNKQRI